MTNRDNRPMDAADLRQKAEALARQRAARTAEDSAALSPDEIQRTLHELRVHQIELEMQNEELRAAQAALEASRARYFDLYDLAPVGYFTLSEKGLILEANLTAATLLNVARGALVKQPITRFILPDDQDIYYRHRKQLFESKEPQVCELRLVKPDGATFWAHLAATAGQWDDGATVCRCVMSDVTERSQAIEMLAASEARYRSLVDQAPTGVIQTSAGTGEIFFVNDAMLRIFEFSSRDEFIAQKSLMRWKHSEERDRLIQFLGEHGEIRDFEAVGLTRTGQEKTVIISSRADGDLLHSTILDITERKRGEAERELLTTAIEQVRDMIVITDSEGMIQYVNPAFESVTGYSRQEAMGQNPRMLKSGEQDDQFYQDLWRTVASGRTWEGRMVNKRKDGRLFTEDASISPVLDSSGRVVSFVAVKRDITEKLGLEERFTQAQKMESVGRLAGGVAHDFNNKLTVMMGYTQMVMGDLDRGDPTYGNLQEVMKAGEQSIAIVRQLLAFARKQIISPMVLDLNETVEDMLKMLSRLIGEDIDLVWSPGHDLWRVKMDPSQVDQILANLCVNARDAIDGVGRVTIETRNRVLDEAYLSKSVEAAPGDYVMLAVSDNGCGMDKETLANAFEPFFTTKEVGKGTGLGLSTVYGIVKQNQGHVNIYSEPGQGTTFKIYLPRHPGEADGDMDAVQTDAPRGRGETILIVEDDAPVLQLVKRILSFLGYVVLTAGSPAEALAVARDCSGDIHLLVTDVILPEMSGRELAGEMLKVRPNIKTMFMSGYTADVIARQGVLEKGVRFMEKPFTPDSLARKVREALGSEE